jgi:hypothetical protein
MVSFSQETGKEVFLIVSRPQFREGLQPFVQWKKQEGFDVDELYVDTNNCFLVKALMQPLFDSSSSLNSIPRYTLLVGDHEQLEAFHGCMPMNGESHFTDLPYSDFMGDYMPETMLGRWPVNDTAELRTVVEKTLRYERFVDIDTAQLNRVLLVAGREYGSPAPTTTNGQVNYLKREIKLAHPGMDTLCWYNPASDDQSEAIANAMGQGACLLNYTGHGIFSGWNHPTMTAGMVAAAGMTQPTVWVNNCCWSNAFTGTGFGEQLLRMPVSGAVGVIGATNSTLWVEDYFWSVGLQDSLSLEPTHDSAAPGAFDGIVGVKRTKATLGEMMRQGNMAVTASESNYVRYYWDIYCLLGDPSLKPWIGVPREISLTVDSVYKGQSTVAVNGTAGVRVTAVQGGDLLGVAEIDSSGHAIVEFRRALDTRQLIITATGVDFVPREITIDMEIDTVGLSELSTVDRLFSVFPNPSEGMIHLLASEPMTVHITDVVGRSVAMLFLQGGKVFEWNAPKGIYYAFGITDKGFTVGRKIIIK